MIQSESSLQNSDKKQQKGGFSAFEQLDRLSCFSSGGGQYYNRKVYSAMLEN